MTQIQFPNEAERRAAEEAFGHGAHGEAWAWFLRGWEARAKHALQHSPEPDTPEQRREQRIANIRGAALPNPPEHSNTPPEGEREPKSLISAQKWVPITDAQRWLSAKTGKTITHRNHLKPLIGTKVRFKMVLLPGHKQRTRLLLAEDLPALVEDLA